jgi:hypothetical protein
MTNALYRPLWTCSRCPGVTFHGTEGNFTWHEREHPGIVGGQATYQMVSREDHKAVGWDVTLYPEYISPGH